MNSYFTTTLPEDKNPEDLKVYTYNPDPADRVSPLSYPSILFSVEILICQIIGEKRVVNQPCQV